MCSLLLSHTEDQYKQLQISCSVPVVSMVPSHQLLAPKISYIHTTKDCKWRQIHTTCAQIARQQAIHKNCIVYILMFTMLYFSSVCTQQLQKIQQASSITNTLCLKKDS